MLYPHSEATVAVLRRAPVIPVLTVKDVEDALAQARALIAGGLLVLEITLRTPAAMGAVSALAKTFPDACIGAGTIVEADQIQAAAAAGAAFLVSPGMSPRLLEAAVQSPVPLLPGAATASSHGLEERGFRALKFFPAELTGGAKYPPRWPRPPGFLPTGGIDLPRPRTIWASKCGCSAVRGWCLCY
jgi:2-dehydro-3-deoxyphosphogluconate aldolase/(4S)-4-hydroxy-2-oxoglutarate aldolase